MALSAHYPGEINRTELTTFPILGEHVTWNSLADVTAAQFATKLREIR
jgi:hypothetical protein